MFLIFICTAIGFRFLLNAIPFLIINQWLGKPVGIVWIVLFSCVGSAVSFVGFFPIVRTFIPNHFLDSFSRWNYQGLSLLICTTFVVLLMEVAWIFLPTSFKDNYGIHYTIVAIVISLILMAWGYFNFKDLKVNEVHFSSPKLQKEHTFILLGDTQIGSLNLKDGLRIKRKVESLFQKYPDIEAVFFVGDAIDNSFWTKKTFSVLDFKIPVPVYFVDGNHEFIHERKGHELKENLLALGYQILEDEAKDISSDIRLIGLKDAAFGKSIQSQLKDSQNLLSKSNQYTVVLAHRPDKSSVQSIAEYGADLQLSGHTHAGQIEPIHTLQKWLTYSYGIYQVPRNNLSPMMLYVTSGAGLWGPKLRFGTQSEVVVLKLTPKLPESKGE